MICLPFSSCSTWVTSPLSLFFFPLSSFFFFSVRRKFMTFLSGSAEVDDRLPWRRTWKTMLGCKQANAIWCYICTWQHIKNRTTISCPRSLDPHPFNGHSSRPQRGIISGADSYLAAAGLSWLPPCHCHLSEGLLGCLRIAQSYWTDTRRRWRGLGEGDNSFLWLCFCCERARNEAMLSIPWYQDSSCS